ncbi:hypothetical protein HX878_21125 [Pseudomonas veronii]|uniref:hypothetical protein n=1 Tax=Pseudomonas veronii TaxID=76761 RepID=UPI0015A0589C|nr:hypothetical protein [Pseudomonas veronii]NWD57235.1 hypothetical protein [Pseudomonas veronii]
MSMYVQDENSISPEEQAAFQLLRALASGGAAGAQVPSVETDTLRLRQEAYDAGAAAAADLLAASDSPIMLTDELCGDELSTAYAMGWNSKWASEENTRRSAGHEKKS